MKSFLAFVIIGVSLTGTAFASYAPVKRANDRAGLAATCLALGAEGQGYGLDSKSGPYGCRNLTTGGAVACDGNGQCTDYSGDHRWKRVQDILKGGKTGKEARSPT